MVLAEPGGRGEVERALRRSAGRHVAGAVELDDCGGDQDHGMRGDPLLGLGAHECDGERRSSLLRQTCPRERSSCRRRQLARACLDLARGDDLARAGERGGDVAPAEGEVDAQRHGPHRVHVGRQRGGRPIEELLGFVVAAGEVVVPTGQRRADRIELAAGGQPTEDVAQRPQLAAAQQVGADEPHQVHGLLAITRGQQVVDGGGRVAGGLEPRSGAPVQVGQPVGDRTPRLEQQHVAEQVVVPVPLAHGVEPDHELVPGGEPVEPAGPVVASR